ncbi:MAG: Acetate kinase [Candidatus Solibacter sp.]|jgi:acetate kinase|nr:Acetate kinase [Candidatus Solibacter sp.]
MRILVFNAGSASLKFDLIAAGEKLFSGAIEGIGKPGTTFSRMAGKEVAHKEPIDVRSYGAATRRAYGFIREQPEIIAHRVVHGGERFAGPTILDEAVIAQIEALEEIAPLHNASAIEVIRTAREIAGDATPMVAVFDTVFHRSIPKRARTYAIPVDLAARNGIHRYGFHGISHEYMSQRYEQLTGRSRKTSKLITLHLESGCSACAIDNGVSVDTSMGFTPLEGLVMGMRCGDIDPAIIGYLARKEQMTSEQIDYLLNRESGLLGLSGVSHDTRELVPLIDSNERVRLAMDVFCYRIQKYIGAYMAAMNGADAIIFGGGIGEDTPWVRERICECFAWCGVELDRARNGKLINEEGQITTDSSRLHAYVVLVEEALAIAGHAESLCASLVPGAVLH